MKWVLGNILLAGIPDSHNMPEEEKTKLRSAIYEAADRGISALRNGELGPVKSIIAMITYRPPKSFSSLNEPSDGRNVSLQNDWHQFG